MTTTRSIRSVRFTSCSLLGILLLPSAASAGDSKSTPPPDGKGHARYTFAPLGGRRQMTQKGNRLYYLAEGELRVVERPQSGVDGEPANSPAPIARLKLEGVAQLLEWAGERTLVAGTGCHLAFIDVPEDGPPQLLREFPVAAREIDGTAEILPRGKTLLVAARRQGLLEVDLADLGHPRIARRLPLPGAAASLACDGDRIVAATGTGLSFIRDSGGELKLESSLDTLRSADLVRLSGKRLAVASKEYVTFYDLTDPRRPVEVAEIASRDPFFNSAHVELKLEREAVYTASIEGGLYVFDWSDLRAPRMRLQFSFWGNEKRITRAAKERYLETLGIAGTAEEKSRSIAPAENVHIGAVGLALDGRTAWLVDWKGQLWGLDLEMGPRDAVHCVVRPAEK